MGPVRGRCAAELGRSGVGRGSSSGRFVRSIRGSVLGRCGVGSGSICAVDLRFGQAPGVGVWPRARACSRAGLARSVGDAVAHGDGLPDRRRCRDRQHRRHRQRWRMRRRGRIAPRRRPSAHGRVAGAEGLLWGRVPMWSCSRRGKCVHRPNFLAKAGGRRNRIVAIRGAPTKILTGQNCIGDPATQNVTLERVRSSAAICFELHVFWRRRARCRPISGNFGSVFAFSALGSRCALGGVGWGVEASPLAVVRAQG